MVHPENSFGFAIHQDTEILQYLENLLNIPVIDAVWVVAVCQLECLNPPPSPRIKTSFQTPSPLTPLPLPPSNIIPTSPPHPPLTLLPPHLNPPSPLPFAPVMSDFWPVRFCPSCFAGQFWRVRFWPKISVECFGHFGPSPFVANPFSANPFWASPF